LIFIGCTNFKEKIDDAIIRDKRLDHHTFKGPLTMKERELKFIELCKKKPILGFGQDEKKIFFEEMLKIAKLDCVNFTIAQFYRLCEETENLNDFKMNLEYYLQESDSKELQYNKYLAQNFKELDLDVSKKFKEMFEHSTPENGMLSGFFYLEKKNSKLILSPDRTKSFFGSFVVSNFTIESPITSVEIQEICHLLSPFVQEKEVESVKILDSSMIKDDLRDVLKSYEREFEHQKGSLLIIDVISLIEKTLTSFGSSENFQINPGTKTETQRTEEFKNNENTRKNKSESTTNVEQEKIETTKVEKLKQEIRNLKEKLETESKSKKIREEELKALKQGKTLKQDISVSDEKNVSGSNSVSQSNDVKFQNSTNQSVNTSNLAKETNSDSNETEVKQQKQGTLEEQESKSKGDQKGSSFKAMKRVDVSETELESNDNVKSKEASVQVNSQNQESFQENKGKASNTALEFKNITNSKELIDLMNEYSTSKSNQKSTSNEKTVEEKFDVKNLIEFLIARETNKSKTNAYDKSHELKNSTSGETATDHSNIFKVQKTT
jgi:hypothetical protein